MEACSAMATAQQDAPERSMSSPSTIGVKFNILRMLAERGCRRHRRARAKTPAADVLALKS